MRQLALCLSAFLFSSGALSSASSPTISVVRVWEPLLPELAGLVDLDGDGREELVVKERQRMNLEILRADADDPRGYTVAGRIAGASPIDRLWAIDLDGDGSSELCIRYVHAGFRIYDGATLSERRALSANVTDIDVGDVDGDQEPEVVIREGSLFRVLDPQSLEVRASFGAPYGEDFELGDVIGDAREEVVLQEGVALQVDGSGPSLSATTVWTNTGAPLERFALTDTDADGKAEIVNSRYFGGVGIHRVTPASGYTQIASYDVSYAAWFGDVDDDGSLDVVTAAAGGHGTIVAIDLAGNELWRMARTFNRNSTALAVAKADASGSRALVWNSNDSINVEPLPGGSGTPWHTLNPAHFRSSTFLPPSQEPGLLAMLTAGVPTGQGNQTVALWGGEAMSDAGGSADVWIDPPVSFPRSTYQSAIVAIESPTRPDEALALVGAEYSPYDSNEADKARLWIMDRSARLVRSVDIQANWNTGAARRFKIPNESQPHLVVLERFDDDTASLVVVGVQDGMSLWRSTSFPAGFRAFDPIVVEDLNADGNPEIVIVALGEALVFDPSVGTKAIARHPSVLAATAHAAQPGAMGALVLSRGGGVVEVYAGLSPTPSKTLDLSYDAYELVSFVDTASGRTLLVSVNGSTINAHSLDSGRLIASTYAHGVYFPGSRLDAFDIDGDRTMEISVAGQGQVVLRLSIPGIFGSGFEDGETPN